MYTDNPGEMPAFTRGRLLGYDREIRGAVWQSKLLCLHGRRSQSYQLWRIKHGQSELQLAGWSAIAFGVFLIALLSQWAIRVANIYL